MRFSVIVPVYNVEKYLDKCLNSIVNQDFLDMEVLLIDDGSTDGSGAICDAYEKKNDYVKVYHKSNGGLSDARNFGIKHSRGDYIIFIDSDDWISDGCFQKLYEVIGDSNVDIVETTLIESFEDRDLERDQSMESFFEVDQSISNLIEWKLHRSYNTWPSVKMIYSREFIISNGIKFPKGRLHEDIDWTAQVIYKLNNYKICSYPWYYHRMQRKDSITNTVKAQNITDVIEIAMKHYSTLDNTSRKKKVFDRIMISVYVKLNQIKQCSESDKKIVINCMKANWVIFKVAPSLKYKIFVTMMKIIGIENATKLLSLI